MRYGLKALAMGGTVAATLAGAAVIGGVTRAQQPSPTPSPTPGARQQQARQVANDFINDVAQRLGVTPERLKEAFKQAAIARVDQAQAAGRLTPEQAQRAKDAINNRDGLGFAGFGPKFGEMGGHMGGFARVAPDQLAQFFGITPDQLRTERRDKSLAEIAQARGKSRDELKQFITSTVDQSLRDAVQNGRLTQQQADSMRQRLNDRLDSMIDAKRGDDSSGNGGAGHGRRSGR